MGTQLPPSIEIFRPGRQIDDSGVEHIFSSADIAGMAACYDPALREAPLCIGHPADNLPAYGWVKGLAVNADERLAMDTHEVDAQFAELVGQKRYKKRSAAFYPPNHPNNPKPGTWYLRHVAFLGAQPPAVLGLKDIQFSESEADSGFVCFSEGGGPATTTTQELSMEEKDRLEAEAKAAKEAQAKAEQEAAEAKAQLAQFAEQRRTERHQGFVQFAEAQLAAGKLKRPDAAALPAVLTALADSAPVEFAEAGATKKVSPAEWLKSFVTGSTPVVQFGEFAPGGAETVDQGSAKGKSDADIDAAAKAYAAQHKVQYAEAVSAVVGFTA